MNQQENDKQSSSEVVYRDIKTGRKIDPQEEISKRKQSESCKKPEWSSGLKQKYDREKLIQELQKIKNEPFARHADDASLNIELESEIRWDDPMRDQLVLSTTKESLKNSSIRRGPPNRYDIPPGLQWDGVDRSNGFEQRLLAQRASNIAAKHEAYKWRSEDM